MIRFRGKTCQSSQPFRGLTQFRLKGVVRSDILSGTPLLPSGRVSRDDGKGFSAETKDNQDVSMGGNGLYNMNKRAEEMHGKLRFESRPGEGTTIELLFNQ